MFDYSLLLLYLFLTLPFLFSLALSQAVLAGKTEKIEKISAELSSAGVLAETALDKLTQANEQLRVDVEKWQEAKDIQWSAVMREWAGNHINYHQKVQNSTFVRCCVCNIVKNWLWEAK